MASDLRRYHERSRRLSVGLLAVLPLLAVYEIGIIVTASPIQNHAGLLVRRMIGFLGVDAYLGLTGAVAVTFIIALWVKRRGPASDFADYGLILMEAAFYAVLLGPVVSLVHGSFPRLAAGEAGGMPFLALLYAGAGVWEELVFRLLLLGGPVWIATRKVKGDAPVFSVVALVASSALFALFHHVGNMAEPFEMGVFLYRGLAGAALGTLFLLRGLGVCVYTHAFYNLGLLLMNGPPP